MGPRSLLEVPRQKKIPGWSWRLKQHGVDVDPRKLLHPQLFLSCKKLLSFCSYSVVHEPKSANGCWLASGADRWRRNAAVCIVPYSLIHHEKFQKRSDGGDFRVVIFDESLVGALQCGEVFLTVRRYVG